jgi:hypothetical protein
MLGFSDSTWLAICVGILGATGLLMRFRLVPEPLHTPLLRVLAMVGGLGAAYSLVNLMSHHRTGVWAVTGFRVILVSVMLGLAGIGFVAFAKLIGLPVLPEAAPRGDEASFYALARQESSWRNRAGAGAGMVLVLAGWVAIPLFLRAIQDGTSSRGLAMAGGWLLILATSGATGGVVYHATDSIRSRSRIGHIAANVVSILAYCAMAGLLLWIAVALLGAS